MNEYVKYFNDNKFINLLVHDEEVITTEYGIRWA